MVRPGKQYLGKGLRGGVVRFKQSKAEADKEEGQRAKWGLI